MYVYTYSVCQHGFLWEKNPFKRVTLPSFEEQNLAQFRKLDILFWRCKLVSS